jgi:hypothetical protein
VHAHLLNKDWKHVSLLLGFPALNNGHSGNDIKNVVTELFEVFGVENQQ